MLAMEMTVPLDASFLAAPLDSGSLDAATGDGGGVVLAEATVDNLGHTELVPCLSIGRAVLLTR